MGEYDPNAKMPEEALENMRANSLAALFEAAIAYQTLYITPVGISVCNSVKDRGDILAVVHNDGSYADPVAWQDAMWLRSLWYLYAMRRDQIANAASAAEIQAVSHDFSAIGAIPSGAFEIEARMAAWEIAHMDNLPNLDPSIQAAIDSLKGE